MWSFVVISCLYKGKLTFTMLNFWHGLTNLLICTITFIICRVLTESFTHVVCIDIISNTPSCHSMETPTFSYAEVLYWYQIFSKTFLFLLSYLKLYVFLATQGKLHSLQRTKYLQYTKSFTGLQRQCHAFFLKISND